VTDEEFLSQPVEGLGETKRKRRRKFRKYARPVITPEERQRLLDYRNHKCAICGRDDVELHIDHSGRNGRIRGALCRQHNTALGMFHDSRKLLEDALRYLRNCPMDQLRKEQAS
jgi:CRISPR/Cas system-associated protein Cas10 (large subunit of type III CRISPR-Cas system)